MRSVEQVLLGRRALPAVALLGCFAVVILTWLGYVVVRQWQDRTIELATRQADDAAELLRDALARDMQGVQRSALFALDADTAPLALAEAVDRAANAFGGYSYPESFFFWTATDTRGVFLHRRDRWPRWSQQAAGPNRFPAVVSIEPVVSERLLQRLRLDAALGRRFSAFDLVLGDATYQVVARLTYADSLRRQLASVFAFTVNLSWVREHYFEWVAQHAVWTDGPRSGIALAVVDDQGRMIAASEGTLPPHVTSSQTFPLFFFNPLLVAAGVPADLQASTWRVQGGPAPNSSAALTSNLARRMLVLQGIAATALLLGLWLTVRAGRTNLRLTELRTDFVSSVTHEFKTPIATIAGAGELLAAGRIQSASRQRVYAGFIVQEARRLSRLVDNLLAVARITDATVAHHHLEWIKPADLVRQALQRFAVHIDEGQFEVTVDASPTLPLLLADVSALRLMLENLIDNAIRHSRGERAFTVRATAIDDRHLALDVEDLSGGIPEDEIPHVTRKFFRGRTAGQGGSGLGLAIATRVVQEHGGTLQISSCAGVGTTVRVSLPLPADRPPASGSPPSPERNGADESHVELADSGRRG